jgi:hypothetical protein
MKAYIVENKLTDGSRTYDVRINQDENSLLVKCLSKSDSEMFLRSLNDAVDAFTVEDFGILP